METSPFHCHRSELRKITARTYCAYCNAYCAYCAYWNA